IIKVDSSGNERWLYIYPGVPGSTDVLFAICEVNSDRFIAAGYGINPFTGSSDIILMEIDSAGTENYRTYIGDSTSTESPSDIITDSGNQGIYICGSTFRNNKIRAYFIYRSLSSLQSVNEENVSQRLVAYPNPSQRKIHFSGMYIDNVPASIFNAVGKLISNSVIQNNELDLGDFENGIYIIRITLDQNTYTFRVSVIH
ncbi:MAG: T9SS type A sorting domain-containing protein, partial [Bacteroidota bacterium]